jgi:putative flippase GtrA
MISAARITQLVRYSAVSVIATLTGQTVLGVLVATRWALPVWANIIATGVGTVPSFELNRRWVWSQRGPRSLRREVVPFVVLSFTGLALSTGAVSVAAGWVARAGLTGAARTLTIQAANLAAFGTLWVVQFVLLDRVLFAHRADAVGQDGGVRVDGQLVS